MRPFNFIGINNFLESFSARFTIVNTCGTKVEFSTFDPIVKSNRLVVTQISRVEVDSRDDVLVGS